MKRKMMAALACAALLALGGVVQAKDTVAVRPHIQLAILLDTSGSMSGLINQARGQIWSIVNEFIAARKDGQRPLLEVALYEYGNDGLPASGQWIRRVVPLTDDLDKVSQQLFALTTNGGTECCGAVIKEAVENLTWSAARDDLKVIVIAGNEPFTQGAVDYRAACKGAAAKGIIVNTIHCGSDKDGIDGKWQDGAQLADGRYLCIDQNRAVAVIATPQDKEIARLGAVLNTTYVPFGSAGAEGARNQVAQDANVRALAPSAQVAREVSKASVHYNNARWDLVDALRDGKADLDKIEAKDLPENMRGMDGDQRKSYVATKQKERERVQSEIAQLNAERTKFLAEQARKQTTPGAKNLEEAVTDAVRAQAKQKSFQF